MIEGPRCIVGLNVAPAGELEQLLETAHEILHLAAGVAVDEGDECAGSAHSGIGIVGIVGDMRGLDGERHAHLGHADYNEMDTLARVEWKALLAVERNISV